MTNNSTKRVPAHILAADRQTVVTIQSLNDYAPHNPAFATARLQQLVATLTRAEEAELMALRALAVARSQTAAAATELHSAVLGARNEVVGQYGNDSEAVHAVGLKQKSERKRPARREASAAA